MMDLYEKIALTSWQRHQGTMAPEQLIAKRNAMWAHSPELDEDQLARHRELRWRQSEQMRRNDGGTPTDAFKDLLGPHMTQDRVHVPATSGQFLRNAADKADAARSQEPIPKWKQLTPSGQREMMQRGLDLMKLDKDDHLPVDGTLQHAVRQHEYGERAQGRAANAGAIGIRGVASHLGEAPNVAERHSLFRDPEATQVMDRTRAAEAGDAFTQRKMRQFGHTPNNPMPLGGRAHRALAREVLNNAPLSDKAKGFRAQGPINEWVTNKVMSHMGISGISAMDAPDRYPVAMRSRAESLLSSARGVAERLGRVVKKSPQASDLYETIASPVKSYFSRAYAPSGGATDFLRHLSSVR